MNDYDDSEDYSSANSFRARSNTWPLNRPDLAVPNCVCIDETLPEIELEDDDLFTTNENWSTGLVDHDIMSWDPILNAQNQHQLQGATAANPQHQQQLQHQIQQQHNLQQQHSLPQHQQQAQQSQPATIHHHHHQHPPQQVAPQPHQRQQPHLQRQQQAPPPPQLPPPHHHHHQQQQQQQLPPPPHPPLSTQQQPHQQSHETLLSESSILLEGQVQPTHQQPQQLPPQHHQTLSNTRCLEADDPNEYHIQQLHHLRIGNGTQPPAADHQAHYISSLSTMCLPGSASAIGNDSYNISSDHQQHHLQPLTSARYDLDQQNELTLKTLDNDHHPHHHQLHHLTSSSLDHHSVSSHMLSSSLSTSGIGLSGDLEDLDYKLDPSTILQNPLFDDHQQTTEQQQQQQQQQQTGDNGGGNVINKQSNSSTSKTKLTTPRRNAWGNMSYADLISQAINSTNDKRLTLSQIYDWMVQHVPYFKDKGDSNSSAGWKNSVRHNLSLHNRFKRLQNEGTGKSSWWTINPEANVGKCARRRAASMEASKYEKKRGRAKKRAEAIRQGLVSFPSLTTNSLNGSTSALDQQPPQRHSSIALDQPQHHSSALEQQLHPSAIEQQQQQQQLHTAALESSALEQQQIQHHHHQSSTQFDLQQQQANGYICDNLHNRQPDTGLYVASSQNLQYEQKDIEWSYSEALRT